MGIVFICLMGQVFGGCQNNSSPPPPSQVRINGYTWTVELATTSNQRYLGLSGRSHLPADRGMLFIYSSPEILNFCMRGCEIPIDIVYIGPDGDVVCVHEMKPEPDGQSRATYSSHGYAQYALELPAGSLERAGIKVGQRVEFINVPDPSTVEGG